MNDKSIIYKVIGVIALLLIGEGVFGWAVYWPALWFLLDWKYVYWLAFFLGFLLVGLTGLGIGWASLVLVGGVWLMSFLKGLGEKSVRFEVVAVIGVAWLANMLMKLDFSWVEVVFLGLVMVFLEIKDKQRGDIRV